MRASLPSFFGPRAFLQGSPDHCGKRECISRRIDGTARSVVKKCIDAWVSVFSPASGWVDLDTTNGAARARGLTGFGLTAVSQPLPQIETNPPQLGLMRDLAGEGIGADCPSQFVDVSGRADAGEFSPRATPALLDVEVRS